MMLIRPCKGCKTEMWISYEAEKDFESQLCVSCVKDRIDNKCECAAHACGSNLHSDWCRRYGLDVEQPAKRLKEYSSEPF